MKSKSRKGSGGLQKLRRIYVETGDIDIVIAALHRQLVYSLRKGMLFEDSIVDWIVESGWGVAGKRDGNRIIITKIPKSSNLREYMNESDPPEEKRTLLSLPEGKTGGTAGHRAVLQLLPLRGRILPPDMGNNSRAASQSRGSGVCLFR